MNPNTLAAAAVCDRRSQKEFLPLPFVQPAGSA